MKRKTKPLIALLTDFGVQDWFVASMKGVIKTICPDADILDITHSIRAHDVPSASFILESCWRDFPPGTVFCCVVDPGVGTGRKRLASMNETHVFIAPDNGLLSGVEATSEGFLAFSIENKDFMHKGFGATFEGRDIFAPAAAHIASGVKIDLLGPLCEKFIRLELFPVQKTKLGAIKGFVVYIDQFGNLITSVTFGALPKRKDFSCVALKIKTRKIIGISDAYQDVKPGNLLAYWGSTGRLEIAKNRGNAAESLGMKIGDTFTLRLPASRKK